ncbi:MAG: RnfABCDGE type electron transport complex subunit D [Pseudomonadota bacterium]
MSLPSRSVNEVTLYQTLALIPPVVAGFSNILGEALVFMVAVLTALLWEMLFAGLRKSSFSAHGLTTALIVTLFCAPETALWQIAVAISLGVVLGELIFGGRGFGFVSAAALSLSLLIIAFPDVALRTPTPQMAALVVPGLVLLFVAGLVSVTILAGIGLGVAVLLVATGQAIEPLAIAIAMSVGAVFLIADPIAASVTPVGRWLYGVLAGVLVVVFSPEGVITPDAIVAAALLASVFAPLIDQVAILIHTHLRRVQHG